MASITSRIDASRPLDKISKPPDCPRRELINLARDKACKTLERKLSGAPVALANVGSKTRSKGGLLAK
jgi:hypothetical protein